MIGYIYKISNTINNKIYIGQTTQSVEARFSQHKSPTNIYRRSNTPLCRALLAHGTNNFNIELIEELECTKEELYDREKYWIAFYDSYNSGYNATKGGLKNEEKEELLTKVTPFYDHNKIADYLKAGHSIKETMEYFGCSSSLITTVKDEFNIKKARGQVAPVTQYDLNGNLVANFSSVKDAGAHLSSLGLCTPENGRSGISKNLRGKAQSAYGFQWKYTDPDYVSGYGQYTKKGLE